MAVMHFSGAFCYTDDIALLSPSFKGLIGKLKIYESYRLHRGNHSGEYGDWGVLAMIRVGTIPSLNDGLCD